MIPVPDTFAGYAPTDGGIASLREKTVRQGCDELRSLASLADPNFRGELREGAKKFSCLWPAMLSQQSSHEHMGKKM